MDSTPLTATYVYMRRNANCRIISCRCVQEYGTTLVHVRVERKGEQKDLRYSRVHDGGLLLCCILGNFCVAKFLQKMQLKKCFGVPRGQEESCAMATLSQQSQDMQNL